MEELTKEAARHVRDGKSMFLPGSLRDHSLEIAPLISWYAYDKEKTGESWRVVLLSPHYQWTVEIFRDILSSVSLPGDMIQRHAAYARFGSVSCIPPDMQMEAMYAKHMLWVIQSESQEVWDMLVSRLEPGYIILAFGWVPKHYWSLFSND